MLAGYVYVEDVWRGTVFTFGFNELGQLGIGASTSSSRSMGSGPHC